MSMVIIKKYKKMLSAICNKVCTCNLLIFQETLEDIDKDKDGRISLEEYIGK